MTTDWTSVPADASTVVAVCLIHLELVVFWGTVVMLRRARTWRMSREACGGKTNGRERWLSAQKAQQHWVLLQMCVFAPILSLDRYVPWQLKWACLYHVYMSAFVNFLAHLRVILILYYRGITHTAPPPWLGRSVTVMMWASYIPAMTMVLYSVSSNSYWVAGLAQCFCSFLGVFSAAVACVSYAILWRRMTEHTSADPSSNSHSTTRAGTLL
jgi:hypothetical protein